MIRKWDCVTGHVSRVEEELCKELGALARRYKHVYVGATSHPRKRADDHESNGRSEFRLLWKTSSRERARYAEKMLIEYVQSKEDKRILLM